MMNQVSEIKMEISGNTAMWTRPDTPRAGAWIMSVAGFEFDLPQP